MTVQQWAIGMMSGTSLDGVDAALLRSDGETVFETGPALTMPYPHDLRADLRALLGRPAPLNGSAAAVARALSDIHAEAVHALCAKAGMAPTAVGVIGFPGQTIYHAPAEGCTVQIGDAARLARLTGIAVATDFRSADVAAGGEGAPLAPIYHAALAAPLERPLAVLNIGGVANVTYIGADGALLAFDTGPGNAPLDDWVARHTGHPFDTDGALAAAGRPVAAVVAALLADAYFRRPPPKSLDRQSFAGRLAAAMDAARPGPADGAATLADGVAAAVAAGAAHFPVPPRRWLVCGGGRHNRAIMAALAAKLAAPVMAVERVGWDGDALEAQCFAYLARRVMRGLPLSLPGTTGVSRPCPGGRLVGAPTHAVDGAAG